MKNQLKKMLILAILSFIFACKKENAVIAPIATPKPASQLIIGTWKPQKTDVLLGTNKNINIYTEGNTNNIYDLTSDRIVFTSKESFTWSNGGVFGAGTYKISADGKALTLKNNIDELFIFEINSINEKSFEITHINNPVDLSGIDFRFAKALGLDTSKGVVSISSSWLLTN